MAIRVDLRGQLTQAPEVRITPAGTPMLRLEVDCGETGRELVMVVVMVGERARELASRLQRGREIRVTGTLRPVRGRLGSRIGQPGIEVMADEITPANEAG